VEGKGRVQYLVEIDFGDLVRYIGPMRFSQVVSDTPMRQELSHLEEVLLLSSFRYGCFMFRVLSTGCRRRRRRRSS